MEIGSIDTLILCGGKGTRLKSVSKDLPKSLVKINNDPFLLILLNYILDFGFNRIILCAGYRAEYIEKFIHNFKNDNINLLFSLEERALGTAGAIKNAENLINTENFLVINGDTLFKLDYNKFVKFFYDKNAVLSIALLKSFITKDFGSVDINGAGKIISYNEKVKASGINNVLVNSGVYLMNKKLLNFIPVNSTVSLELDTFPLIIGKLNDDVYGYISEAKFIDIGTSKNYYNALKVL
jgi:D-glycero-alpha-D-manno-heptose 1-phosphate guanylyltransferase